MIGDRYVSFYHGKESHRGILIGLGAGNCAYVLKDDGWIFVDYATALRLESKVDEDQTKVLRQE